MDRQTIQSLLDQAYEARRSGDIEGLLGTFHPEATFEIAGSKAGSASAVTVRGQQEFRETLTKLVATFNFLERTIISCLIDGNRAAVHSRVKLECAPTNKITTTDLLDLWKFDNGKVVELIEFVDTAAVNDLVQKD
jgi:ketosteroid isomerase-like protein